MSVADEELQRMLDYCSNFGRRSIEEAGEFDPFAGVINQSGQAEGRIFSDPSGRKTIAETYEIAAASLMRQFADGEIRAAALVANVRMPPDCGTDYPTAIKFEVETSEGSLRLYLPYQITKKLFRRRYVEFGEMIELDQLQVSGDG